MFLSVGVREEKQYTSPKVKVMVETPVAEDRQEDSVRAY